MQLHCVEADHLFCFFKFSIMPKLHESVLFKRTDLIFTIDKFVFGYVFARKLTESDDRKGKQSILFASYPNKLIFLEVH